MVNSDSARFAQLLDWLEGRLPEAEARALSQQLEQASDEATAADLAWLRRFLEISKSVKLASPPHEMRAILRQRFAAHAGSQQPPGFFRRLIASLSFDSRAQWAAAGLRSAANEGQQRQLIYTTDVAEIALNLQPHSAEQRLHVAGQVFPTIDVARDAFSVQLLQNSSAVSFAATDELGEFAFGDVPPGEYAIVVSADQFEVVIPSVSLHT
ncbi:MAG TPA: carboxypeptidase-like regulatory domain-containing protein [Anaerolineae bacterium]|nr:carboxypeptidase-like regulatory domain-containing protein [Anaerolineae bacterium]